MKPSHKLLTLLLIFFAGCSQVPATQPVAAPVKGGITFKNTVVSLTFDDGDADNYSIRSTLAENNLHATFYIVSGFTNTTGYMSDNQLHDLYNDGNEIGGHTLNHAKLTNDLNTEQKKREVCQDRSNLLAYGFEVTSFAYPYGYYDDEAKQIVRACGYNNARIVSGGPESLLPTDVYALHAMPYIVSDTSFSKMFRYVINVENEGGGWAIFVFHHVCNGCDQYSVSPDVFTKFTEWLGSQQTNNGLIIKTVGEMVGGETQPAVAP